MGSHGWSSYFQVGPSIRRAADITATMLEFDMDVPTTLSGKIGLIADKGRIFGMQGELFTEESWLAVMLGQGIIPR